ncbi:Protein TORNADO 1 [Platanthera guangdongensis]|uniref:Protein TORNADO 1 n=1 Tax=Platanthera guangdongensis TaxID=2320717 RepID=A0ABR2LWX3_9ASPA
MSNPPSSNLDLDRLLQLIISREKNLQNISFSNTHSSTSFHQETENSISINIPTNSNKIHEFRWILTALAAPESGSKPTNLVFYGINWEPTMLHALTSMFERSSRLEHVEFQKNVFSENGMWELSDMLGRNRGIRSIIFSECGIESTGALLISSALMKNVTLEELQIWEDSIGSNGAEELSRMIEVNSTLRILLILDRHSITAAPLISVVLSRNRNIEVHIWSKDEADANLKIVEFTPETSMLRIYRLNTRDSRRIVCALGWNTTVKSLDMSGIHLKSNWAKEFRQVLEQNRSLKEVKLSRTSLRDEAVVQIAAGLFKNKSLEKLALDGNRFGGIGVEHLLCPLSRFSSSQNQANTTLKSVTFGGRRTRIGRGGAVAILRMLDTNHTIEALSIIEDSSLRPEDVVGMFRSLEKNATLRYLSLGGCSGVNGELVMQTILGTLQVNPWIETIDLAGTPLQIEGKTNVIYRKLGNNASLVPENELLDNVPLTKPKCCRVFFCGQDLAGKSTLCGSIYHNFCITKIPFMDHIRTLLNPVEQITRTAEVKIKSIQDGDMKISIWNLAGQHENFALHDIMFPSPGSPSFFFVVSSLFRKPLNREPKSLEEIEDDLLYWLRFIVSNSRRAQSQSMLPHITIVLTHLDKVLSPAETLDPALSSIQRLREIFQGFVEVYPMVFMVDSRSSVSVSKLTNHMRKMSMTILQKVPQVYEICNDMIEIISNWRSENHNKPAMKWNEFCELCQLKVPPLRIRSRRDNVEKVQKKRRVVANSLHHVGEVIFFQDLGYIILDSMWFFGKVLSQLTKLVSGNVNTTINHGFVSWLELERILRGRLKGQIPGMASKVFYNLEADDLVRMMLKLELCYEEDTGKNPKPRLLIPSILKDDQGRMPTWNLSTQDCVYVGRHLKCHDTRHMLLTMGFFPRLQVQLHNKILKLNEQKGATYALEKDLISITINGIEVRVEFGAQNGNFIDVLACSNKTVTEVLRLFSQLIMPTIHNLCPGTALSEYVIRPDCVRYLIPPTFRRNQLVSSLMLKEALLSMPADSMYDYQHTWSSAFNGNRLLLHSGFDYARNLLSDEDFHDVLHRRYRDLHHLATELTVSIEHPQEPQKVEGNDGEQKIEPSLLSIAKGVELILQRLKVIDQEIKDLKQEIQGLKYHEHCLLVELHRKVDYLVNYNIQLEERKTPNMFYFVQVQNYSKRLVTRIISGMTALRLHMLCEYRREMHVVEDQVGCELLQVDNEAVKSLLPYMSKFMKLLTFALKIGAHFAAGMGEMIPDLGREVAHLIDSSLFYGSAPIAAGVIGASAKDIGAAQQWLLDFLKGQRISTGKDIADRFALWRVRYLDNGHIAWICQGHKETRSKEIAEIPF